MMTLTQRQEEILDLIRDFITDSGMPPTRAEIANALGFRSPNAAEEHLRALERKGAIELFPGASRGIRILEQDGLPLIGRISAGKPMLAEDNIQHRLALEPTLFRPRAHYVLKVRGMSMRDAGILDGDLLAVHKTHSAASGQIIVGRLNNEITVKRFKRRGNTATLQPENPSFKAITVNLKTDDFAIEGIVVGVLRNSKKF